MHLAINVALHVVNDIMDELLMQTVVADPLVGINGGFVRHFAQDFVLQGVAPHVGYNLGADFAQLAVEQSHYYGLVHVIALELLAASDGHSGLPALVGIGRPSGEKGLRYFGGAPPAALLLWRASLQTNADAVKHEPCG